MSLPLDPAVTAEVVRRTYEGQSAAVVGAALGLTVHWVYKHRAAGGVPRMTVPWSLTPAQIAAGDRLSAAGVYPTEIARTIGCGHATAARRWPAHRLSRVERSQLGNLVMKHRRLIGDLA